MKYKHNLKIKTMKTILTVMILAITLVSCTDDLNYSASVNNRSYSNGNFNGDVTGNGGNATYSFTFYNNEHTMDYNMDITADRYSAFRFILTDGHGYIVLDRTLFGRDYIDTFSGVTYHGVTGVWEATIIITDFNGDGSYSASIGD